MTAKHTLTSKMAIECYICQQPRTVSERREKSAETQCGRKWGEIQRNCHYGIEGDGLPPKATVIATTAPASRKCDVNSRKRGPGWWWRPGRYRGWAATSIGEIYRKRARIRQKRPRQPWSGSTGWRRVRGRPANSRRREGTIFSGAAGSRSRRRSRALLPGRGCCAPPR